MLLIGKHESPFKYSKIRETEHFAYDVYQRLNKYSWNQMNKI